MNSGIKNNVVVYILSGQKYKTMSERVKKLLKLKDHFEKLTLITKGKNYYSSNVIELSPIPNPTGILRLLGFNNIKKKLDRYLFFPTPKILYVRRARKKIEKLIKKDLDKKRSVCLITSVPPHDVCMAGLFLKKKFPQIYWIVDWRDLWSYDENYLNRTHARYRNKLLDIEREVLNKCDVNITTNSYARTLLIDNYKISPEHVVTINHSFSRDDFPDVMNSTKLSAKDNEIKIGFLGTLFKPPKVPGEKLIEAIRYVHKSDINVKFHHYGSVPDSIRHSDKWSKVDYIFFHGEHGQEYAWNEISVCDYLLLVLADLPNCKTIVHIKLPEYLLLGKPIIAIVPEQSAVSDLIKKTNCGYVIPASQHWGKGLKYLLDKIANRSGIVERNITEIEKYNWETTSKEWIQQIMKL